MEIVKSKTSKDTEWKKFVLQSSKEVTESITNSQVEAFKSWGPDALEEFY